MTQNPPAPLGARVAHTTNTTTLSMGADPIRGFPSPDPTPIIGGVCDTVTITHVNLRI